MENEQKNQSKYMNVSIYILFVVLGIVFFGGQAIMEQVILDIGQNALWIYLIAIIIVGYILNSFVFELGKVIFGRIANFDLIYTNILGFTWSKNEDDKTVFSMRPWENYGSKTVMVPNDVDDCNVTLYTIGGLISVLIIDVIILLVGFLVKIEGYPNVCSSAGLIIALVGLIILILNMEPFFQDGSLDVFYLRLITIDERNKEIYFNNLYQMNALYTGRCELEHTEYEEYDNILAVQSLFYDYYYFMDQNDEESARKCVEKILENKEFLLEEDQLKAYSLLYYFKLKDEKIDVVSDEFLELDKSIRKECAEYDNLDKIKTALLVAVLIEGNYDLYEYIVNRIDKVAESYLYTYRRDIEIEKIEEVLTIIEERKPEWFNKEV